MKNIPQIPYKYIIINYKYIFWLIIWLAILLIVNEIAKSVKIEKLIFFLGDHGDSGYGPEAEWINTRKNLSV